MAEFQNSADETDLFEETPLDALNFASLQILETLNDKGKMVELNDGSGLKVCDNFTGLAEQDNFTSGEIKDLMQFPSPMSELITEMEDKNRTVADLSRYLYNMGRMDVINMSHNNWVKDCSVYKKAHEEAEESSEDVQVTPGNAKQFDAFISYAYPDLRIAKKMIRRLENQGFKLFVPGRDDLPGGAKYVLTAYVIEKKCRRVIILLTRAFSSSPECDFQLRFSNALDPGAREMKIIPVICEKNAMVPRFLNFVHKCDITKNEWQSLYNALSHKPHCQNTKVLEKLTYPLPAIVEEEFKGPTERERHQPDGDSGAKCDRTLAGGENMGAKSVTRHLDNGELGAKVGRRPHNDSDSGVSSLFAQDDFVNEVFYV